MKFGEFSLSEVLGATLAHSVRHSAGLFKKGHVLNSTDIQILAENNITHVMAAIFTSDDMPEDAAATRIANHIAGDHVRCAEAFTGRVNLYAKADGLLIMDEAGVNDLNHRDEAITCATLPQNSIVHKGQMIATVKIIPLAVATRAVEGIVATCASLITLHPFQPQRVFMIQTALTGTLEKLFEKTKRVMTHRLDVFGATLEGELRCAHEESVLADILTESAGENYDITLIMGATAITDRRDVIPAAITKAGGEIIHYGMPVDPGNLMLLAKCAGKWILGLPGCSRSPKLNGIDLILSRISAGRDVTGQDIMGMGVGGLLSEYVGRPLPREGQKKMSKGKNIAALVLAAGQSKRMGPDNKLLLPYEGGTVLSHVLKQVKEAGVSDVFAVTGHNKGEVTAEINGHDVTVFHNDLYAEGMSTSVKCGISSLPQDVDAVMIILGDMPNVSADILKQIMTAYEATEGRSIIIPQHNGKRGNPILWDREFFDDFDRLEGDMGAKILLAEYAAYIQEIDVGSDAIFLDIDTYEAYERLSRE